jgi:transcription termination/antitermination protein NusA
VMALQPGIDPVGACVGMRGVRIQSIVRELNDEKIDVIEWDPDQKTFIAKALSPARVSQVFLEDHPEDGKTAVVIVPNDQLSLAIGREGQNARLAAKLTGWRIDIKSLTEAAAESLSKLDHPAVDRGVAGNQELIDQVNMILAKKEAGRPITNEDYAVLNRLVTAVEGEIINRRAARYDKVRKERSAARKRVPQETWELPLEELELPTRVQNLLEESGVETVGEALFQLETNEKQLLNIEGFGEKSLADLREAVGDFLQTEESAEAEAEEAGAEADVVAELEPAEAEVEAEAEPMVTAEEVEAQAEEEDDEEEEAPALPTIDDLERPLVEPAKPAPEPKKPAKTVVVVARPSATEEETEQDRRGGKQKAKQLVFDESAGKVVAKRKRKPSRRRPEWEEYLDADLDELL